jgi:hypothetical protein
MGKCELHILFDRTDRTYVSGEKVTGIIEVRADAEVACKALTLTPEWRTRGKGNTATGETAKITLFQGRWLPGERVKYKFSLDVPSGPVTYHGQVLNVDWHLKARAHIPWAVDAKAEEDFIVVCGHGAPDPGAWWKQSAGRWVEENRPHQTLWHGIITVAFFVMPMVFGWQGLVILIGLLFCFGIAQRRIHHMLVQRRLGVVEVMIEPRAVLGGGTAKLHVSFEPRVVADLRKVTVKFVGRERVISGDSDCTHTQMLYEETAVLDSGRRLVPGRRVDLCHELRVPTGAPPTFKASDNHLEWIVTVHFDMLLWPDWKREYPITVVPYSG